MRALLGIMLIMAASFTLAAANYAVNPRRPNLPPKGGEISLQDLSGIKEPILFVDARNPEDYEKGHIENALNLSESQFEEQLGVFLDKWALEGYVLVYCNAGQCNSSRVIAERLKRECGIQNVFVLKGDWRKWKKSEK